MHCAFHFCAEESGGRLAIHTSTFTSLLPLINKSWASPPTLCLPRGTVQVGTDIILVTVYCSEGNYNKTVKLVEKALLIGSIAILSSFVVEWLVEV